MKELKISTSIQVYDNENELPAKDNNLINCAKKVCANAYSPYSKFNVGAAVLLEDGTIVTGSNQENAAYPSGLCAERVALFAANSQYPNSKVVAMAVAAQNKNGWVHNPIPPCGSCRQVLVETENRFNQKYYLLLHGQNKVYKVNAASDLLPLSFIGKEIIK